MAVNSVNVTKNFKLREFSCKADEGIVVLTDALAHSTQKLRDKVGKPLIILDAYWTKKHCTRIKGSQNSPHRQGRAVVISTRGTGKNATQLAAIAKTCGFSIVTVRGDSIYCEVPKGPVNTIKISEYFRLREFACKDGSNEIIIEDELFRQLNLFRKQIGRPFIINSAFRNEYWNKAVGGATRSQHRYGSAVDISIRGIGLSINDFANKARALGFRGVIKYKTFVHVDSRTGNKVFLDYR